MKIGNLSVLLISIGIIVAAIIYLGQGKVAPPTPTVGSVENDVSLPPVLTDNATPVDLKVAKDVTDKMAKYPRAKEITTPDGFINTGLNTDGSAKPITIGEFIAKKVVLLDIWTYSCINCQRTIPYLNSWYEKYKDKGLVIIGLHTPEFEFEKVYDNVLAAVKKFGITYPVVLDNDYSTWQAYRNQYWPRHYLIDIDGYIVADHIGEGGYEETERQIQKALAERMTRMGEKGTVEVSVTPEVAVPSSGSPETYFGAARNQYLGNGTQNAVGVQTLTLPKGPASNKLYLGGEWDVQKEYAQNTVAGATVLFKYKSKEVYFVASSEKGVTVKVYNDGVLQKGDGVAECSVKGFCGGEDVSADGTVFIKEDRLYKLIQNKDSEEHVLKIEIESTGLKAFTFTFG